KKLTMRTEIAARDRYLATGALRFGERLRLEYAIEEPALNALVPSLLLQPLLEISLKYAGSAREQGGRVRIEGRVREGLLELSVIDDGPGLREGATTGERRGVGLSNTRERLAVLYGENHRFAVLSRQPGLRIEMALPLESAAAGPQAAPKPQAVPAGAARGARAGKSGPSSSTRRGCRAAGSSCA